MQHTINERLKFLISALNISARRFSAQLGVPESNTRNYLDKRTKLNSDYLERIITHFKSVNLIWLLTGEGEMFTGEAPLTTNPTRIKRVISDAVTTGSGDHLADCEKARDSYKAERDSLAKQVELLHGQLTTKDALIASKEETIVLLRTVFNRPG